MIGATTAIFCGLLGIVHNDIKRVVAYSTLSQLGYMTVALGVSAYGAGIFHLMTHAFFKALLFLAAGSVIIAMHHEQDMRRMGGLCKYMPITSVTSLIGSLALIGSPCFSGFFSKDAVIEAVHESHRWGAHYAYWCLLIGVFVTALYSFRLVFMTFHGEERMDARCARSQPHESPWVVTVPLILLAIPSVMIGYYRLGRCCSATTSAARSSCTSTRRAGPRGTEFHGPAGFVLHAFAPDPSGWRWRALPRRISCTSATRPGRCRGTAFQGALHAARQQVLLRLVQRERDRAARAWHRAAVLEGWG